jgi:hypothetical protein
MEALLTAHFRERLGVKEYEVATFAKKVKTIIFFIGPTE